MSFYQKGSPEFRTAVGKILQRQRQHLKLYQENVAREIGVRAGTIYQYESGECTPSLSVMFRLVDLLKLDWAELRSCLKYDYKTKSAAGPERALNSSESDGAILHLQE